MKGTPVSNYSDSARVYTAAVLFGWKFSGINCNHFQNSKENGVTLQRAFLLENTLNAIDANKYGYMTKDQF